MPAISSIHCDVHGGRVDQHDVERIARATLRELGVVGAVLTVVPETQPGQWRIDIRGGHGADYHTFPDEFT